MSIYNILPVRRKSNLLALFKKIFTPKCASSHRALHFLRFFIFIRGTGNLRHFTETQLKGVKLIDCENSLTSVRLHHKTNKQTNLIRHHTFKFT